jgi:two-component system response regulator HupR/HoxA
MSKKPIVLIIDDEIRSLESLERILDEHFEVRLADNTDKALAVLRNEWVQIVLCDQRMPDMPGTEFLKLVKQSWPDIIRMIISGYTDAEDIIMSINEAGIYQYITKPWQPQALILTLQNAARLFALQRENQLLAVELKVSSDRAEQIMAQRKQSLKRSYQCDDGVVRSADSPMNAVCDKLRQVAPYDVTVLLTGESGTGKELAARALHYNSLRWNKPFVVENCAALPDELLESELFGHKRGAFTGAVESHVGLFERADGGTVFLDEIGDISPAFQVKLLRVLQEGEVRPVGDNRTRQVDIRVIAATNRNLMEEVRAGRFREDLYYRLSAIAIHLPPLRERWMDIPPIAEALLKRSMDKLGKKVAGLSEETIDCLAAYHWPGNVRELQNEIQHILVMAEERREIPAALLSPHILRAAPTEEDCELDLLAGSEGNLKDRIEGLEARILKETLIRHHWNKSKAARELGLSRVGLRAKLERYGLEKVESIERRSK